MPVFKIARYEVRPEERAHVERAIHEFATFVRTRLPDSSWVTYRDRTNPNRFVSLISAEDEAADERHRNAEGTRAFVEALYPRLAGEVEFADYELVASSSADST
jgi:quinol monooxygenase YgiN